MALKNTTVVNDGGVGSNVPSTTTTTYTRSPGGTPQQNTNAQAVKKVQTKVTVQPTVKPQVNAGGTPVQPNVQTKPDVQSQLMGQRYIRDMAADQQVGQNVVNPLVQGLQNVNNSIQQNYQMPVQQKEQKVKNFLDYTGQSAAGQLLGSAAGTATSLNMLTNPIAAAPTNQELLDAGLTQEQIDRGMANQGEGGLPEFLSNASQNMMDRAAENEEGMTNAEKYLSRGISGAIGQAPQMIANAVVPFGGDIWIGLSSFGNAWKDAKEHKLSDVDALRYATANALTEVASNRWFQGSRFDSEGLFDGIKKNLLSKVTGTAPTLAAKYFADILGEQIEEESATIIEYLLNYDMLQENRDADGNFDVQKLLGEVRDTWFDTLASTVVLNAVTGGYSTGQARRVLAEANSEELGQALLESAETFVEMSPEEQSVAIEAAAKMSGEDPSVVQQRVYEAASNLVNNSVASPSIETAIAEQLLDKEYNEAVDRGDMETAQRMVDNRAAEHGYGKKAYHGTRSDEFTRFAPERIGANYSGYNAAGGAFDFTKDSNRALAWGAKAKGNGEARVIPAYLNAQNTFFSYQGEVDPKLRKYLPDTMTEAEKDRAMSSGTEYHKAIDNAGLDFKTIMQTEGYDSYSMYDGDENISVYNPNQIKSSAAVTYDDNGNVIPLSERFNPETDDIRYSMRPEDRYKDAEYQEAVDRGDMGTAQKMVDEAASAAGYTVKAYHGTTEDFNTFARSKQGTNHDGYLQFGSGFYFTPSEEEAKGWVSRGRSGMDGSKPPKVISVYLNPQTIIDADSPVPGGSSDLMNMGMSQFDAEFCAARAYRYINTLFEIGLNNTEVQEMLKSHGINAISELFNNGTSGQYVVFDPEQIKSADPVTYDDDGNVIPISERFNPETDDIRYSLLSNNAEYMAAVETGNLDEAQKMVDRAAEEEMKGSAIRDESGKLRKVYHGTNSGGFSVFDDSLIGSSSGDDGFFGMGFYFAYSADEARYYGKNVYTAYLNIRNPFNFETEFYTYGGQRGSTGYAPDAVALINLSEKFPDIASNVVIHEGDNVVSAAEFSNQLKDVIENKEFSSQGIKDPYNGDDMTLVQTDKQIYSYENDGVTDRWEDWGYNKRWYGSPNKLDIAVDYLFDKYDIWSFPSLTNIVLDNNRGFTAELKNRGYDGVIQSESGDEAVAFYPEQIKSADPVTYDDEGNVIPLSERFNDSSADIRYEAESDSSQETMSEVDKKIANSMTMDEARQMLEKAWNLYKEYEDAKSLDEFIATEPNAANELAMWIENTYELQEQYINRNEDILNDEYTIDDVIDAYLGGRLRDGRRSYTISDIPFDKGTRQEETFYTPKSTVLEDPSGVFATASQRLTKKNENEVLRARAEIVLFAHNDGAAEALGLTQAELNKKLSRWTNYSAKTRNLSKNLNKDVPTEYQWKGLENSNSLSKYLTSNDTEVRDSLGNITKDIKGDYKDWEAKDLINVMLSIDSHISYRDLTVFFDYRKQDDYWERNKRALGFYNPRNTQITVGSNGIATLSHEVGHFIDNLWGREILSFIDGKDYSESSQYLSEVYSGRNMNTNNEALNAFITNFNTFVDKLTSKGDIGSEYTQRRTETFARFVDYFVAWVNRTSGGYGDSHSAYFKDRFTVGDCYDFVKLLQQKSMLNATVLSPSSEVTQEEGAFDENLIPSAETRIELPVKAEDLWYKDLRFDTKEDRDAFAAKYPNYVTEEELAEADWNGADDYDDLETERYQATREFNKYESDRLRSTTARELFEHPERFGYGDIERFLDAVSPFSLEEIIENYRDMTPEEVIKNLEEGYRSDPDAYQNDDDWNNFLDSNWFLARLAPGTSKEEIENLLHGHENSINRQSSDNVPTDDASYMAAVLSGDMDLAQRIVDARAREQGYDTPHLYHGTPTGGFNTFDIDKSERGRRRFGKGAYFTDRKDVADHYQINRNNEGNYNPQTYDVYLNLGKNPVTVDEGESRWKAKDNDLATGAIIREVRDGSPLKSDVYVAKKPSQIKSAEAVTYDDNGNVIPLSERFNPKKDDIRWSLPSEEETKEESFENYGISPKKIQSISRNLKRSWRTRMSPEQISDYLTNLYKGFDQSEYSEDEMRQLAKFAARDIANMIPQRKGISTESQMVLNALKETTIQLTDAQREEARATFGNLREFQKQIAPIKLRKDGTMLADAWNDWIEDSATNGILNPETYDDAMPAALAEVVQKLKNSTEESDYDYDLTVDGIVDDIMHGYMESPQEPIEIPENEFVQASVDELMGDGDGVVPMTDIDATGFAQRINGNSRRINGWDTFTRVLDTAAGGDKEVRRWFDSIIDRPLYEQKRQYNENINRAHDALEEIVKKTGIRAGTKESAAVQWYGENLRTNADGSTEKYGLTKLKNEFPDKWQDIVEMEQWCKRQYISYVDRLNAMLEQIYPDIKERAMQRVATAKMNVESLTAQVENTQKHLDRGEYSAEFSTDSLRYLTEELARAEKELAEAQKNLDTGNYAVGKRVIPRKNYFHHFLDPQANGLGKLSDMFRAQEVLIDSSLVGVSDTTKPKSKWASFLQRRGNGEYTADAVGGMARYMPAAEYKIAIDPFISHMRGVVTELQRATSEKKNANNLIGYLSDWTNALAGKTGGIDRSVMELVDKVHGRADLDKIRAINGRFKGHAVGANIASAIKQISNIPTAMGQIKSNKAWAKGFGDYLKNKFMGDSGALDQSVFMTERYFDWDNDEFKPSSIGKKITDFSNWMMGVGDHEAAKLIWYAAYEEALEKGVDDPIFYADRATKDSVGGRGIGEVPVNLQSKVVNLLAPFQLEVTNTWNDLVKMVGERDARGVLRFMVGSWAMESMMEDVFGLDVLPDVIGTVIDTVQKSLKNRNNPEDDDEDKESIIASAIQEALGQIVSMIPGNSLIAQVVFGINSDTGEELFGEGNPSRYELGLGGVKDVTQFASNLWQVAKGKKEMTDVDLFTPLVEALLPFGGRQLTRSYKAAQDLGWMPYDTWGNLPFAGGERHEIPGAYTSKGDLKFELPGGVENVHDLTEIVKALLFGEYATDAGKEYLESGKKAMSSSKVAKAEAYADAGGSIEDYKNFLSQADADGNGQTNLSEIREYLHNSGLSDDDQVNLWKQNVSAERAAKADAFAEKGYDPKDYYLFDINADADGSGNISMKEARQYFEESQLPDGEQTAIWETIISDSKKEKLDKYTAEGYDPEDFLMFDIHADADGNGSVSQAETTSYLDSTDLDKDQKSLIFMLMFPKSEKKNPYK